MIYWPAWMLVAMLVGVLLGVILCSAIEANAFNMTEDLIEEERQLMLCIEWKIENVSCSQIYGGIDGSNGEPLK